MLLKITREKGVREMDYIKVVYKITADEGLDKFAKDYTTHSFYEMLKLYFGIGNVTWFGTDEGFDHYEGILRVKTKDEIKEKEKTMHEELSELVEAFKDYLRQLPEIEKKEWVWE